MHVDLSLRFQDTSLDPYVRFFEPRLSPFTIAVASGTVRVSGEVTDLDRLAVETRVEQLDAKLFDYALRNDGPIEVSVKQNVIQIGRLKVAGEGTQLQLGGAIRLRDATIGVEATGEANLGILQGFFRNVRSRGTAALLGEIKGPLTKPQFSGSARIVDGRIRHLSAPHGFEAINGIISFDAGGIRLEDMAARVGGGDVTLGGRIALNGFAPGAIEPDRPRRTDASALPRRLRVDRRRGSGAARRYVGSGARRIGHRERRRMDSAIRSRSEHLRVGLRRARSAGRAGVPGRPARCASTFRSARRTRFACETISRTSGRART